MSVHPPVRLDYLACFCPQSVDDRSPPCFPDASPLIHFDQFYVYKAVHAITYLVSAALQICLPFCLVSVAEASWFCPSTFLSSVDFSLSLQRLFFAQLQSLRALIATSMDRCQ